MTHHDLAKVPKADDDAAHGIPQPWCDAIDAGDYLSHGRVGESYTFRGVGYSMML